MFDRILKEVILPNEGGYVNSPNDRGGATNFGITQATFDKYCIINKKPMGWVINITQDEVRDIYFKFWTKARCDLIFDYAPALTVQHFDFLVNSGYERRGVDAAEILQRTIRIVTSDSRVIEDGHIGPLTLGAVVNWIRIHPLDGDKEFWIEYVARRKKYYYDIVANNPSQQIFLNGWLNRIEKTNSWIRSNIFGNKL